MHLESQSEHESIAARSPWRIDQHPIKFAPNGAICPTEMAASKVDIMEAKIKTTFSDFIGRNSHTIVFICRGKHRVKVTKNHPGTARIPSP